MKFKCYPIPALYKKVLYKIKNYYFDIASKNALPKANFYSGLTGCGNFVKYAYVPALNEQQNPTIIFGLHSRSEKSARKVSGRLRSYVSCFLSLVSLDD